MRALAATTTGGDVAGGKAPGDRAKDGLWTVDNPADESACDRLVGSIMSPLDTRQDPSQYDALTPLPCLQDGQT